jgi:hypothetical protein
MYTELGVWRYRHTRHMPIASTFGTILVLVCTYSSLAYRLIFLNNSVTMTDSSDDAITNQTIKHIVANLEL